MCNNYQWSTVRTRLVPTSSCRWRTTVRWCRGRCFCRTNRGSLSISASSSTRRGRTVDAPGTCDKNVLSFSLKNVSLSQPKNVLQLKNAFRSFYLNCAMAKSEEFAAWSPSLPEMPTPTSAFWIMATSLAPSPMASEMAFKNKKRFDHGLLIRAADSKFHNLVICGKKV